jgi:rod shape-determining protein MreC
VLKKRNRITGLVVFILLLVLLSLPDRALEPPKSGVRVVFAPVQRLLGGGIHRLRTGVNAVVGLGGLAEKNRELSAEIIRLQAAERAYQTLERENRILREQLHFFRNSRFELIPCEVIARGISGWWSSVRLSKGIRHGVAASQAVVSPDGLIGKTVEAGPFSSEVLLISDPDCRISARIARTGSFGLVRGRGSDARGRPVCGMSLINRDIEVRIGDEVVTSGLGGVFPAGIRIGYVESMERDESGLYQRATVVPAADLGLIEFVFAVRHFEPDPAGSVEAEVTE